MEKDGNMSYPNPYDRKSQIDRLRAQRAEHEDNDWFFDKFDQTLNSGAKGFFKLGAIAMVLNLVYVLVIIAAIIFGLSLVF